MKKSRFTEDQMVGILCETDQKPVPEVAKKHGVSDQSILWLAEALRGTGGHRREAAAPA